MNILGIDFEDWFHPELIQKYITNEKKHPQVIDGIHEILDLLRKKETNATFFVVGELLEFKPDLLDLILDGNHEIAFHTMNHDRIDTESFKEKFIDEIEIFSKLTNKKSKGFRAPTFSLNNTSSWIIDQLEKSNYIYDSSIVPAKTNLYGMPNAEISPYRISSNSLEQHDEKGKIIEFPIMITKYLGKKIPAGGGFYLRFLSKNKIRKSIENYEKKEIPSTFYIHSWELTPEFMPKIKLPFKENFVTFHNVKNAYSRMESLLQEFEFSSFDNFFQNTPKKFSSII